MKKKPPVPTYRKQKYSNGKSLAFVVIGGRRVYLGPYGSDESKTAYQQVIAEAGTDGYATPLKRGERISVVELIARYLRFAKSYYRKPDGQQTRQVSQILSAIKPLRELYGRTPADEFGPKALKGVRAKMIQRGWSRKSLNRQVGNIKRLFKWAVENELVKPSVYHGLLAVSGLRAGRSDAKESKPIKPLSQGHIDAVRPLVSRQVWGLVQLQLHTAARPGELLEIRSVDIDTSGRIWLYRPTDHKTAWHGHTRTIYIGPKAQAVLRPFMQSRPLDAPLFSPKEAIRDRFIDAPTPRRPDQKPNRRKTGRTVRDQFDVNSYRRAIHTACRKAGIPQWSPHRLRHTAATMIRKEYGLEAAQVFLGHRSCDVTQVYAEVNHAKGLELAARIG